MAKTLVNGVEYSWVDVRIRIGATEIVGLTSLTYNTKQEKANIYGTGEQPVSRGKGSKEYEGSMSLLMSELELLRAVATDGDVTNLAPFDLQVTYAPTGDPTKLTNHTLQNCEFMENPNGGSQGDTSLPQDVPFIWAGFKKT
jgi:hypothetical protein